MASDQVHLSPEIRALVREIAARDDSTLLRVDPSTSIGRSLPRGIPAGSGSDALSRAEAHLLAVYREEVASALRQCAWSRLFVMPAAPDRIILRQTALTKAPRPAEWDARRAAACALRDVPELDDDVAVLLEACVTTSRIGQPSVGMLCTAADRLAPSFSARYHAGAAFILERRVPESLGAARQALLVANDPLQTALAYNLVAGAFAKAEDWSRARAASERAIQVYPELLGPYLELAWAAVRLWDAHSATTAMRELELLTHGRMELLDEQQRRLEGLAAVFRATLDDRAVTTLRRVVDASSSISAPLFKCILDADPYRAAPSSVGGVVGSGDPREAKSRRLRLVRS